MSARSMHNFLEHYGSYRLQQILEILADPEDPAPQEHIAQIMEVSKSTVSKWVKDFIYWKPELKKEEGKEADYFAAFELYHAQKTKEHLDSIPRYKTPILHLADEKHRA